MWGAWQPAQQPQQIEIVRVKAPDKTLGEVRDKQIRRIDRERAVQERLRDRITRDEYMLKGLQDEIAKSGENYLVPGG